MNIQPLDVRSGVFGSLSLTHSSLFGICSVGSNRTVCIICSFCTVHVRLGPYSACLLLGVQRMLCPMPVRNSPIVLRPATRPWQSARKRVCRLTYWRQIRFLGGWPIRSWAISVTTFRFSIWMASTRIGCSIQQFLKNQSPCQLSILWDFVHFSGCGILSCGILSCGILSVGLSSCGILSCGILSGYRSRMVRVQLPGRVDTDSLISKLRSDATGQLGPRPRRGSGRKSTVIMTLPAITTSVSIVIRLRTLHDYAIVYWYQTSVMNDCPLGGYP